MKIIKIEDVLICRYKYLDKHFRMIYHYNQPTPYIIQQDIEDILDIENIAGSGISADYMALLQTKIMNRSRRFIRIISYSAIKKLAELSPNSSISQFNQFLTNEVLYNKKSLFKRIINLFANLRRRH